MKERDTGIPVRVQRRATKVEKGLELPCEERLGAGPAQRGEEEAQEDLVNVYKRRVPRERSQCLICGAQWQDKR